MATKGMTHQKDAELRDALITLLRQSGIAVSTNVPEAERILQENRNRIHREHQINTDPVLNGVISVFSKKYELPVEIVRSYFEGMGNEDLHQAQQAYYAIRRAYRENVKTELRDGFKLSAFSEKFAALKNELYNVFGDVDALRDREVQKAQDYRNMMDAARRETERKLQAEYDRLQPYRDMSDTEIDDLYMRTLPHEVIEQYSVTEKQAAIDTLADDQKALLTDLLTVMQERRGYTSTTDYQGQGAWVAPGNPGYATDEERRANVLEDGGDVNIEDIAKGITPQPEDYFSNLRAYGHNTKQGTESARAIHAAIESIQNGGNVPTVRAYRAVPKDIEEGMFRNGDWVTMSPEYAKIHGELRFGIDNYRVIQHDVPANKLWWDGNDINEWGFDDGQGYRYKNTLHNRKSDSLVTFDDKGEVIPLSKRYDERTADIRYMYAPEAKKPFFISNAQMALDRIKQDKASPMQWLKMLQKNGGIKAGEDRWTGLSEWLQESTEKSLSRQQIEQYIADNHIRLEEVHYYEGLPQQAQDKLDAYNEEFHELIMEGEEQTGSLYTSDWVDWAFATMLERYGDDFYQAFEIGEGTGTDSKLTPNEDYNGELSDQAKHFLGFDDDKIKQINNVRLEYTSDGLENKREIALTVPSVEGWNISDSVHFGDADNGTAIAWVRFGDTTIKKELSPEEKAAAIEQMPKADQWELVDGSHFTNRNDVYFAPDPKNNTRFGRDYIYHKKDQIFGQFFIELSSSYRGLSIPPRYGFDSLEEAVNEYNRWKVNQIHREERILVIDEIQSKRHQEGREKGYAVSEEKATREMDSFLSKMKDKYHYSPQMPFNEVFNDSELKELQRLNQQQYNASFNHSAVPDAPFEKNWQELAMKRMLRYAAENGYDRLAWLNGLQQAERYSLGGKVDSIYIDHSKNNPERYSVTTYAPDTGIISPASPNEATKEDLHEIFGKNIAEQLLDGLADLDQKKERGETYRNKSFVLEGKDLEVGGEGMKAFYDRILPNFMNKYGKQWGVQVEPMDIPSLQIKDLDYGHDLHSVRITGLMNRDVMEGQPMFFRDGENNIYGFVFDETVYIDPRIATAEVPIHEYAHLWAAVMRQQNPDEWANIVSLMKDIPELWQNVEKQYAGSVDQPGSWKHLLDRNIISQERYDSWIADEVLAMYSGHRGYERLAALTEGKENGMEILQKVKEILERFWHSIAENYLHIHYDSKEQVADQIMKDLLSKVNPLDLKTRPVTGLHLQNDNDLSFSLTEAVNGQRAKNNQHLIVNRNELSYAEKEIQKQAWRAAFHSLSETFASSEMPSRAGAPGTPYAASKPLDNANIGRIFNIEGQLDLLLTVINKKNLTRESFINQLAGSLGMQLSKDSKSRYTKEPLVLGNGDKVTLRVSNHAAHTINFIIEHSNEKKNYGIVFRGQNKNRFIDNKRVNYLELYYSKESIDNASDLQRRDFYREILQGLQFMLRNGSLEEMPFPDHLNASGKFREPLMKFREEHPEMLFYEERQIDSRNFKEWFGNWKQPTIFTAYNVNDSKSLQQKYPSELPNKFYHHSTVSFGQQPFNTKEGEQKQLHITGRLTTDKVDVLIVENPESNNAVPHITLATAKGVKPAEANNELSQHLKDIIPMDDYVSTTFRNNLDRNMSKVVDATGQPLMVEHGTYQNFTVFDKEKIGSNSKDEGLFGTGFYFAKEAPGWLGRETTVPEGVTILTEVEELKDIFKKAEPTTKDVAVLKKWLNSHKDNTVRLYHGTDADIPVTQEGLKKTSAKTKRSLQSGTGNVYLTPFPTFAKAFGQFAYPDKENIAVYAVDVKVKDLHADKDQLKNKRMAGIDIGDSLAASLLAGHSATVRRNIPSYELQRHTDFHVMKVFLDIKRPFKIQDTVHMDMYGQIRDKMDSRAFRELTVKGFNDRQTTVGEYIDQIKAVDRLIAEGKHTEMMKQDPELQFIHPKEQLRVWREHEISRRTGFILPLSWQVLIAEQIGSRQFTAAAQKDRYDGVIVDRAYGEKEYVAFEPSQIKSATDNIGLFSRENNDIRFMKTTTEKEISKAVIHKGRGNTLLVRAEINGREQPSKELSKKDAASFRSGKTTAENLARKYFSETIDRVYKSNINR